jgi:RimJ/RimL family protein N-acetyltransferase
MRDGAAFGWWPNRSTPETVAAAFHRWALDWSQDGPTRTFAVRDKYSGELLGGCEFCRHEDTGFTVSYWTGAGHRRRGIATRALRLLLLYADGAGITDITCDIADDNIGSRRVAEESGFTQPAPYTDDAGQVMLRYVLA